MACVWKSPKSRYWIAQFPDESGKRVNRSTKKLDRKKAIKIAETWEQAARKAARHELTQAQSIRVLDELMRESLGAGFEVQTIEVFLHGWVESRKTMQRAASTTARYLGIIDDFLRFIGPRGKASVASVSTDEIEKWRDFSLRAGISPSTADFNVKDTFHQSRLVSKENRLSPPSIFYRAKFIHGNPPISPHRCLKPLLTIHTNTG